MSAMNISELKIMYETLLRPILGEQFYIDDSEESSDWITFILDGEKEDFMFSLYGIDSVRLFWCNECFIFDKHRNGLVSSDTCGEIVFEDKITVEQLPQMIVDLIVQLKDCIFVNKTERIIAKTPSGYDDIKDYVITAKTNDPSKTNYKLANIAIEYIYEED